MAKRTTSTGYMPKKDESEMIKGSCENCGHNYKMKHHMKGDPKCKNCGKETQNWDTVNGSQMAPSIVKITK